MHQFKDSEKGVALVLVIISVIVIATIASYALTMAFNQKTVMSANVGQRTAAFYSAQAGVIEAQWRIRTNTTSDIGGGDFTVASFDPAPYYLDIETDTIHYPTRQPADDIEIDIGPEDTNPASSTYRLRTIKAKGTK